MLPPRRCFASLSGFHALMRCRLMMRHTRRYALTLIFDDAAA